LHVACLFTLVGTDPLSPFKTILGTPVENGKHPDNCSLDTTYRYVDLPLYLSQKLLMLKLATIIQFILDMKVYSHTAMRCGSGSAVIGTVTWPTCFVIIGLWTILRILTGL
jgi:hypothetical protein